MKSKLHNHTDGLHMLAKIMQHIKKNELKQRRIFVSKQTPNL